MITAQQLIQQYSLQQHPEGGWYKETYKSNELVPVSALPHRFGADRFFSTAIYFLLEQGEFSAFHRIKSDECWHFYAGDPLSLYVLDERGEMKVTQLGKAIGNEQLFQFVVPANCWFASRPSAGSSFSFVGCTVSPGFDFADFEMGNGEVLSKLCPEYEITIRELSKKLPGYEL